MKTVRKVIASEVFLGYKIGMAVFHSPDKTKWRFTLVIREFTEAFTVADKKPESYTYVFGSGEKGRTAAERFYQLAFVQEKTLPDLEQAFSVEALSKKFFDQYKEVYQLFTKHVEEPSRLSLFPAENKETQQKLARDFVKKMMGRIVFLYFLQKKGWMGCETAWNNGDEQFMQHLFESATPDNNFYSSYLEPLFFDTLNRRRENQNEECIIAGKSYGKVPFLNGGLFEREDKHPDLLTLDWNIFQRLFEVLNSYNFTIIEDDPDYKEVAVNPEMLGHIFENLLEDNKDKGAFYTPKEIVQYMCQESLIEYLTTQIGEKGEYDNEALSLGVRELVMKQEFTALNDLDQRADRYVLEALRTVKVCDPAIGSGAFPMGILHEIFRMVEFLQEDRDIFPAIWGMAEWNPARVKEEIIQHSIYGVDIEKGAVDIARLRFWLSIIIDEDEPRPLPNLDYKIVIGNSLLNKFEDQVIDIEWDVTGTQVKTETQAFLERRSALLRQISKKQETYFGAPSSKRTALAQEIKDLKIDILTNQLEIKIEKDGIREEPKQHNFAKKKDHAKAMLLHLETRKWQDTIAKLSGIRGTDQPFGHFDWELDFPEVLNPIINSDAERRGFDIVIGNPPYIRVESVAHEEVDYFKKVFASATSKFDLSSLFFEKSVKLVKEQGFTCFISTYQFLYSSSGLGLRTYLSQNAVLKMDIFSSSEQVFDNAITYTGIFKITKSNTQSDIEYSSINKSQLKRSQKTHYKRLAVENFVSTKVVFDETGILDKILAYDEVVLGRELGYAKCGVVTSADDVFLLSESKIFEYGIEKELLYPILGANDLKKWALRAPKEYCLYPYHQVKNKTKLLEIYDLQKNYSNTWQYLLLNEERLRARSQGRKSYKDSMDWYKLNRPREKWIYDSQKIIYPGTTKIAKFAHDRVGEVFRNARLYAFVLESNEITMYKYLICILNSFLGDYMISIKCPPKNNGYFEMSTDFLESFPFIIDNFYIPKLNLLYDKALQNIKDIVALKAIENEINKEVTNLYGLESEFVEKHLLQTSQK